MTLRTGGNRDAAGLADGGDLLAANDDRLVVLRRRARAVDDARVRERDDGRIDADVLRERRAASVRCCAKSGVATAIAATRTQKRCI